MKTVYDAGWQGGKVQAIVLFCAAMSALMLWIGFQGMAPEPAAPHPLGDLLMVRGIGVGGALLFGGGAAVYARLYVRRAAVAPDGTLHVRHPWPFGARVLRPGDVVGARWADVGSGPSWYNVRLRGRRLPLILDPLGDFAGRAETERAFGLERGTLGGYAYRAPVSDSIRPVPARRRRPPTDTDDRHTRPGTR